jgi:hypothetical protein
VRRLDPRLVVDGIPEREHLVAVRRIAVRVPAPGLDDGPR